MPSWRPWWRGSRRRRGSPAKPLKALLFDSWYDSYRGAVSAGAGRGWLASTKDRRFAFWRQDATTRSSSSGAFAPFATDVAELGPGEVGFITAAIKEVADTHVGDTITEASKPCDEAPAGLPGCQAHGLRGHLPDRSGALRGSARRPREATPERRFLQPRARGSAALGFGFRCGFLGLLHMEIVQERLEREYNLDLVTTAPSVVYRIVLRNGDVVDLDNPAKFPAEGDIDRIEEPIIAAVIHMPPEFVGGMLKLCQERRGTQTGSTTPARNG